MKRVYWLQTLPEWLFTVLKWILEYKFVIKRQCLAIGKNKCHFATIEIYR